MNYSPNSQPTPDHHLEVTLGEPPPSEYAPAFGRFHLMRKLGAGGMAEVWLAHDDRLHLDVALKFLPGLIAQDAEALHDLRREITRGLRLTHAGIVRLYDFHVDRAEEMAAISMEYVDGATLAELKLEQPHRCFACDELLCALLRPLFEVLTYVHEEARVIHRDLKPRNLLVTSTGRLKVTDFGIAATLCETVAQLTRTVGTSGTPAYMSPQQHLGRLPSVRDDVYALGATVYELITSKPPFVGLGSVAIDPWHHTARPLPMHARRSMLCPDETSPIPAAWEETIQACLQKEPEHRPADVREVARRLGLADGLARSGRPARVGPLKRLAGSLTATMAGWRSTSSRVQAA